MMNNQHLELLNQASNEAIFITLHQAIVSCNDYALNLFAYKKQQIIGMSPVKLFEPGDANIVQCIYNAEVPEIIELKAITCNKVRFDAQLLIKPIQSGGDTYISFSIRDISDFKYSQQQLLARDALLEAVSFAAAKFLESKNWRKEITSVLQYIGESAQVSRVYIFQNFLDSRDKLFMCQKYEWVAAGIEPQIENLALQKLYYRETGLGRLEEMLQKGEVITGLVEDFPLSEREILKPQGIISIYLTPIFQGGLWWGFIGYDECNYKRVWNQNEIKLLNTVADIFNSALDQEQMEWSLKRNKENFKSLFDNSPDAIFVYDHKGFILDVNEMACDLNGIPKPQFIKKHISELVPPDYTLKVSQDFAKWVTGELKFVESRAKNKNGDIIPVEIRGSRISYFDTPAVLLLVRDIHQRKENERLLIRRFDFIQFISQISSEFIKIDLKNIEGAVNKALEFVCRFTGNERGYVFMSGLSDELFVLTHEYCDPDFKPHKGILDSIVASDFEEFFQTLKSGEYIISHFDEIPDDSDNENMRQILEILQIKSFINIPLIMGGHFLGFIGFDATRKKAEWDAETINAFMLTGQIISNIIIRKKSEDELIEAKNKAQQSDQLKTAFLGQISHEMRTPLNSIIGFAEMLRKELPQSELQDMSSYILQGGNRLLNTFNLIIDLAEIEANVMQANFKEVELGVFFKYKLPMHAESAEAKNLKFIFVNNFQEIIVRVDENLLEKIIHNLIDNAIKYTRKGSIMIILNTEQTAEQQYAVITIKDTGIGIKADKMNDIFRNFRQASEGYNREFEGAGLGLSVTLGMVRMMNGEISVRSEIDEGSEFKLRFPLIKGLPKVSHQLPDEKLNPVNINNMHRILVVEDELVHQKYLNYILKEKYKITFVESGSKAIDAATNNKFDLIIMDINLGKDLNGLDTLAQIKAIDGYAGIRAIAATANVMKGHKEHFLTKGFTHYIPKPYRANEMKALVDDILKKKYSNSDN